MVIKQLFSLRKTNRPWHLPAVAGLCVGIPLLLSLYLDDIEAGKLASVGALVILYIQRQVLTDRLMALMVCSFGFILSYAIGSIFSFGFFLPSLILGLYTFAVHFSLHKLGLDRPPGNFFFIMVASMAIATPKEVSDIAIGVGNLALGVIIACVIGLFYSLLTLPKGNKGEKNTLLQQNPYSNFTESIILGITVGASLLVAKLLHMENPYWIPISCMAVMQGNFDNTRVGTRFATGTRHGRRLGPHRSGATTTLSRMACLLMHLDFADYHRVLRCPQLCHRCGIYYDADGIFGGA